MFKPKVFVDNMLGRDINDPSQLPPVDTCQCLHGTPRIDSAGRCTCDGEITPPASGQGPRNQFEQNGAGGIWSYMPLGNSSIDASGPTKGNASNALLPATILGLPTGLVLIAAAAAGLYFVSQGK
jgi:hypothetical protein